MTQLWLLTHWCSLISPVFASLLCFALFQTAMPSPVSELRGLNVKHHEASFLEDYTFQQASPCIRALRDPVSNRVTLVGSFQLMWVCLCLEAKFRMRVHGKYHVTWNWPLKSYSALPFPAPDLIKYTRFDVFWIIMVHNSRSVSVAKIYFVSLSF